jgi:hypothetical protein
MIYRPVSDSVRTARLRACVARTVETGPLTELEREAVTEALLPREQLLASVRGADTDDVYLWIATERRALQFIHAVEGVFLLRVIPLSHLQSMQLITQGPLATMRLTSRRRTYMLDRLPLEDAVHFAHQLGIADLLIAERSGEHPTSGSA